MDTIGNPCRLLALALWAGPLGAPALADTLDVPAEFPSIQAAIAAAQPGDKVLVASGTYFETIDFLGKGITVQGLAGATIDGRSTGSVVSFVSGEPPGTTLRGFTIRGGMGSAFVQGSTTFYVGGGVKIVGSHATLENCAVMDNLAFDRGGGVFVHKASASAALTLRNCWLWGNQATNFPTALGGGLYAYGSSVIVTGGEILENTSAGAGGGFAVEAEPGAPGGLSVTDCFLTFNTAMSEGGGGWARLAGGTSALQVVDCGFTMNQAQSGGALAASALGDGPAGQAIVELRSSRLYTNTAAQGAAASLSASAFGPVSVSSCMLWGNQDGPGGASLVATGPVNLRGSTIAENTGAGLRLAQAQGLVDSCLIWGNGGGSILHDEPVPDPIWCVIEGGFAGITNIDVEPVFVCAPCGDYHLAAGSPCLDAGNPAWLASSEKDVDGNARVQFGRVDIGADEANFPAGPWKSLGHALAGAGGTPSLVGAGTPAPGSLTQLLIMQVAPNRPAWLVGGAGELLASFKGGLMVPALGQLVGPISTTSFGAFSLTGLWPSLPVGFTVTLQVWISDPSGPAGFTATNGLAAKTQ